MKSVFNVFCFHFEHFEKLLHRLIHRPFTHTVQCYMEMPVLKKLTVAMLVFDTTQIHNRN